MHSPAAALAWEFWWRHRWGLAAVAGLVAATAAFAAADPLTANAAIAVSVVFAIGLLFTLGVFAYGFEARLEAPESGFPARLLLLPVRTSVLVGWPMLQGVAAVVLLWLAWDRLVLRPSGVGAPGWWAAAVAAVVATGQALMWCPFGLPWLRLLVACVVLTALSRAPALLDLLAPSLGEFGARAADRANREAAETAILAAVVPVAFLFARAGVARARRGDSPDWVRAWRAATRSPARTRELAPFASAMRAQVWYEWRLRGRGYVVTVVIVTLVLASLSFLGNRAARGDFALIFFFVPPLIAALYGSQTGSPGESIRSSELTTFAATRPLADAEMVAAKVRAATRAAAAAWLAVAGLALGWLAAHDGYERMESLWEGARDKYGWDGAFGRCVVWAVGLTFATWRGLTANLWVGLCGRTWLVPTHLAVVAVVGLQALMQWGWIDSDPVRRERFLELLPWVVGGLVAVKIVLAWRALGASVSRGLVDAGGVARHAAGWALGTGVLIAVLVRFGSHLGPWYWLAVAAVLFVPLARPAAAPLALAWNRHR